MTTPTDQMSTFAARMAARNGPTPQETIAADTTKKAATINPANDAVAAATPVRRRIPMSTSRRKLEVPDGAFPGFVLYWFLESNLTDAINAGYEFVKSDEIKLNQLNPANSADESGNTDLGTNVTILGNKANEQGKPEQLVLMKIREEWWKEDRQGLEDRNASIIETIFGKQGVLGSDKMSGEDKGLTYVKTATLQRHGGVLNRGLPKKA